MSLNGNILKMSLCQIIQPFPMSRHVNPLVHKVAVFTGDLDEAEHETSPHAATISRQPRKEKRNAQWMDTAASALSEQAKGAASSSKEDDELLQGR